MDDSIFLKWEYPEEVSGKEPHRYSAINHQYDGVNHFNINGQLIRLVRTLEFYELEDFFEYHFNHYKGKKRKFLNFIKNSLKMEVADFERNKITSIVLLEDIAANDTLLEIIDISNDWIDWKKKNLATQDEVNSPSKPTRKKDNQTNKQHELTHKQKVLMKHFFTKFYGLSEASDLGITNKQYYQYLSAQWGVNDKNTEMYFNSISRNTKHNPFTVNNLIRVIEEFKKMGLFNEIPLLEEKLKELKTKNNSG